MAHWCNSFSYYWCDMQMRRARSLILNFNFVSNQSLELTPLSLAIFMFLDSLFILFFPIILYAIRRTSPQR